MKDRNPFRPPCIKSEEEHYDRKTLLDAIKDRACEQGYSYGRPKESPESSGNYHLGCGEERCKHSILVGRASEDDPWTLRVIKNDHNHQPITTITRVPDIAPRVVKLVLESKWDPKDVRALVRDQTGLEMTKDAVNKLHKRWKTHQRLSQPLVSGNSGSNARGNTNKRQELADRSKVPVSSPIPIGAAHAGDTKPTQDDVLRPSKRPHRAATTRHAETSHETGSEETESESDDDFDDSADYVDKSYSHKPPAAKRLRTGPRLSLQTAGAGPSSSKHHSAASLSPSGPASSALSGRSSDPVHTGSSSADVLSPPRSAPSVTTGAERSDKGKGKSACQDIATPPSQDTPTPPHQDTTTLPNRMLPQVPSLDDGLKKLLALKTSHETKVAHHKTELARYQAQLRSVEEKIDILTEEAALEEMAARRAELQREMEHNDIQMEARKKKIAELRAREEAVSRGQ